MPTQPSVSPTNLFGAARMGYIVIESKKLDDWRRFLKQGIGLHLETASDAELAFRMDDHARRIVVRRGPAEDVVALGYQLRDQAALDEVLKRLVARDIAFEDGSEAAARERGVASFVRCTGPKGMAVEFFADAVTTDAPLHMLASGFVTGDSGMGHVAITSRRPEKMQRFWQEILDARLSDKVSQKIAGVMLDVTFLRLNERHHSVAVAATRGFRLDPIGTQIQHLNMLVNTLGDVTEAFARLKAMGFEMAHEIGQHPNDHEISFYVISPSGFEVELGWDATTVDEDSWKTGHYNAISLWGHKPQKSGLVHNLLLNAGNAARGLRSLRRPEHSPL